MTTGYSSHAPQTSIGNQDHRIRSWWLLWAVPGGFTTWLMFFHIAHRTRKAQYLIWAGVYLAGLITWMVLAEPLQQTTATKDATDVLILAVWVGGFVQGVAIRRRVNQTSRTVLSRSFSPVSWTGTEAAWQVAASPSSSHLPTIDVEEAKKPLAVFGLRTGIPMALVFLVLLGLNHHRSGLIGFGIALVIMAVLVGVEGPLLMRAAARRQSELLASAPSGTAFVGTATFLDRPPETSHSGQQGRTRLVPGFLAISSGGLSFRPGKVESSQPVDVPWSTIARIDVRPAPNAPLAARLDASLRSGSQVSWTVRGYEGLAKALNGLRVDAESR